MTKGNNFLVGMLIVTLIALFVALAFQLKGAIDKGERKLTVSSTAIPIPIDMKLPANLNQSISLNNDAIKYVKINKLQEAKRLLDKALELSPDFYELYFNRGCVYFLMNDAENALTDFDIAAKFIKDKNFRTIIDRYRTATIELMKVKTN